MAIVDLVMPKLGESITEATVLKWLKQPGDAVQQDETLLEIATDKVDSEVPSTAEGTLEEILFDVNAVVPVGAVIARIRTKALEAGYHEPQLPTQPDSYRPLDIAARTEIQYENIVTYKSHPATQQTSNGGGNKFYSPLVLNIAASEGISMQDLENIPGTGNDGRVTKKDILQFVQHKKTAEPANNQVAVHQPAPENKIRHETVQPVVYQSSVPEQPTPYAGQNVEIIEMDRMRRLIADHMVRSKQTSAHVTSFSEADVTNLVMWRERVKKDFEKREAAKLTFTPLFVEAVVRCIKKYPLVNSSLDGNNIIVKKDINIGMATALETGNLIVPVIRNADQLNLTGLAKQVNGLADKARSNKLKPEDTQGGTFTLTNVGTFGSLMGTPIINQPQVAILAVGVIKKRPVVVETPMGDSIAIRHMMYLSMSYDHRIVDGSLGATFLSAVARELENFDPAREV